MYIIVDEKVDKYMKVLFAITNQAKVGKYKKALKEKGIELITINDLDFKLDINENGKNAIENAYIKARVSTNWEIEYMYVFASNDFTGELIECNEEDLKWIEK